MDHVGGAQRLRLGPRNEGLVAERDHAQILAAERDRLVRHLEELEQSLKTTRRARFNELKNGTYGIQRTKAALSCKENYLQEAEQWQKQLEHHQNEEERTRAVLHDLLESSQVANRVSDAKANLKAKMHEAKAEIKRVQQDVKALAASAPAGSAEDQRSVEEIQAEIDKLERWLEANPSDAKAVAGSPTAVPAAAVAAPVAVDAAAPAANASTGANMDGDGARSGEAAPTATAAPLLTAKPPPKAPGKGKGKGPSAPGPPAKGKGKAGASPPSAKAGPARQSKLVTLNWTMKTGSSGKSQAQETEFNSKLSELVTSFGLTSGGCGPAPTAAAATPPGAAEATSSNTTAAAPNERPVQETVFDSIEVKQMPDSCLEYLFKAPEIKKKEKKESGSVVLDAKCQMMCGIVISKYMMSHKGESQKEAVCSIKRGLLQCDMQVVPQELMALVMNVIMKHAESGSPVSKHVKAHGEASLDQLQSANDHRFVYELLKVPQITERLECMLFESDFGRSWSKCLQEVKKVRNALEILKRKQPLFRKFFTTAHRLGQALNRGCKAPQAPDGFDLRSLEKFASTKPTRSPKHNLLHVVIALMNPEDVLGLMFPAEDMQALREAKALKIGLVHQNVVELLNAFNGVRDICKKGTYTRNNVAVKMETKRKTMAPTSEEARIDDPDDKFLEAMENFVDSSRHQVQLIARNCCDMMKSYEDLAMFFNDMTSVYPPPKKDNDPKVDMVAMLHDLAEQVPVIIQEVNKDGLRQLLSADLEALQ